MSFSIHTIYHHVFKIWRRKRFALFLRRIEPRSSDLMLDVGGNPFFWLTNPQPVKRIDTLNIYEIPWDNNSGTHDIRVLMGDGCALEMPDKSYDIAFSNSVIEHVGSWEKQQRFASEIRRVGKSLWVQTPAFECPIEPHYMTPLMHYLPRSLQRSILRWCSVWGWIARPTRQQIDDMVESTRLIRKSEMEQLFPDCEIVTERMLWIIPKSYVAIRRAT